MIRDIFSAKWRKPFQKLSRDRENLKLKPPRRQGRKDQRHRLSGPSAGLGYPPGTALGSQLGVLGVLAVQDTNSQCIVLEPIFIQKRTSQETLP